MMGVIDESLIDHAVAAGRWIIASEIPVASMVRNASPQVFAGEEDDFQLCVEIVRKKPFCNGFRQFVVGELFRMSRSGLASSSSARWTFSSKNASIWRSWIRSMHAWKATSSLKDAMSMP